MNKIIKESIVLLSIALLSSCGKDNYNSEYPNPSGNDEFTPIVLTKAESIMTNNINTFGLKLLQQLVAEEPDKNVLISPLSISLALAMTAGGAEGETAKQMCEVLGFSGYSTDEMGAYYSKIVSALKIADRNCAFEVANSIWLSKLLDVKQSFIKASEAHFASEVKEHIDFSNPSVTGEINKWVSDKTHGKIKDLLRDLDPQTRMVLVNALYFNGRWGFEWDGSKKETFYSSDGNKSRVEMMHFKDSGIFFSNNENNQSVSLPYGNGAFLFTVILPDSEAKSFGQFVSSLSEIDYKKSLVDPSPYIKNVTVKIPSFKIEYKAENLKRQLESIGMILPFSAAADFSGISEDPLYISNVVHQTFIDVNLSGTEAAAATAVFRHTLGTTDNSKDIEFIADHPFIYAIREASTGAILFLGTKQR